MKRFFCQLVGWILATVLMAIRLTCQARRVDDPAVAAHPGGGPFIYAVYHAHQIPGLMGADPKSGIIVSKSKDGDIVVPLLRMSGQVPIRGSSGPGRKGGASALRNLCNHLADGHSVVLTVDGPRGPRGHAQRGVGKLAMKTNTPVLCGVATCSRRWIIKSSWDRLQIPKPFARVRVHIAAPMQPHPGETLDAFVQRIENQLQAMELQLDPSEAIHTDLRRADTLGQQSAA